MWPPTVVAKEKKRTTLGAPKLNFDLPKRTSRSSCGRPAPRDTRLIKQSAFSTLSPELCCALHGKLGKFSTKQASRQKEGKKGYVSQKKEKVQDDAFILSHRKRGRHFAPCVWRVCRTVLAFPSPKKTPQPRATTPLRWGLLFITTFMNEFVSFFSLFVAAYSSSTNFSCGVVNLS